MVGTALCAFAYTVDLPCRAISFGERAGQTNCRRSDQAEQLGNPLTILTSTETLRLDLETQAGDTRNCHFHKTICSIQGGLHTAQAPPGEVRLLHSQYLAGWLANGKASSSFKFAIDVPECILSRLSRH